VQLDGKFVDVDLSWNIDRSSRLDAPDLESDGLTEGFSMGTTEFEIDRVSTLRDVLDKVERHLDSDSRLTHDGFFDRKMEWFDWDNAGWLLI